jgi:histone H3/H4
MSELLVVRSRLKEVILKYGKNKVRNMSEDFAKRLSEKVETLIADAVKRADENKRATVQSRDL